MGRNMAIVALLASLVAGSAFADTASSDTGAVTDAQLGAIGLAGFQPMNDSQASTVRGKSYSHGSYTVQAGVYGSAQLGQSGIGINSNASATNTYKTATASGAAGVVVVFGGGSNNQGGGGVASVVPANTMGGSGGHVVVGVFVGGFATAGVH